MIRFRGAALLALPLLALPLLAVPAVAEPTEPTAAPAAGSDDRPAESSGQRAATPTVSAPAGFTDRVVLDVPTPTSVGWTPDGRMLLTSDGGQLRVVRDGVLRTTPALDLSGRACTDGERGLSGLAVDPGFATNRHVYLFWTHNVHGGCETGTATTPENRVARYTLGDDDRVVRGSERVLVDHLPSPASNHNGGDVHVGADGLLYISVGDGGCTIGDPTRCAALNTNSRRRDIPNGKILRVTRTGGVPAGNPNVGLAGARRCTAPAGVEPGSGPCTETFASGLRNPFRIARRPGTSSFLVNDVGQGHWEEIDELRAGRDYGWNVREGHCATGSTTDCGPTPYQNPIFDYDHANGCQSITGGAFVPKGLWPAPYDGAYLFADFVCGTVFRLAPRSGGGYTAQPFLTGVNRPVHLAFGPSPAGTSLYYLDYFGGQVHRVSYTGGTNTAPVAAFSSRPDGLPVAFDAAASDDPDSGDTIARYSWSFGDGTSAATTSPRTSHTYPSAGTYRATLRITDSRGAVSSPVTRDVYAGEHPPTVTITAPASTARFAVGQSVQVQISASDREDGALAGSRISTTVLRHHGNHDHPYLGPVTGSSVALTYPAPEDLAATTNSHLRVLVTATDSRGLSTTIVRWLRPHQVALSFATSPAGGQVRVQGVLQRTPVTLTSWEGWVMRIGVPSPQTLDGRSHVFRSWSDGGARFHDVRTPGRAATYTATLVPG